MADYIFRKTVEYTGWADARYGDRWYSQGGHWDTREEFYDNSSQFWCVNLSEFAKTYPGYIVESIVVGTWTRKKKHSERFTIKVRDFSPGVIYDRPNQYPVKDVYNTPLLAPLVYVWSGKGSRYNNDSIHRLYKPIPIEHFLTNPLLISINGDPNSRREYGWARFVGVQAYKEQKAFPGWTSEVMGDNGFIVPGEANQLLGPGHWLSEYTGGREYLGFSNNIVSLSGWVQTQNQSNVNSYVPGTVYAGTIGYLTGVPSPRKRIKAIKIGIEAATAGSSNRMYVSAAPSKNGGYSYSNEKQVRSAKGEQVTDWIPVTIERGGVIFVWLRLTRDNTVSWNVKKIYIKDIDYY